MSSSIPPPPPGPPPGKSGSQIEREERADRKALTAAFNAIRVLDTGAFNRSFKDKRVSEWLERPADEGIVEKVNAEVTAGKNMGKDGEKIRQRYLLEEGMTLSGYLKKREIADDGLYENPNQATHNALRRIYDATYQSLGTAIKTFGEKKQEAPASMAGLFEQKPVPDDDAGPSRNPSAEPPRTPPSPIDLSKGLAAKVKEVARDIDDARLNNTPGVKADATPGGAKQNRFTVKPVEYK